MNWYTAIGAIAFLLIFSLSFFGCSGNNHLQDFQDELHRGRLKLAEARAGYEDLKREYIKKRDFVKKMIELYYGDSKEASVDDDGIQDLIFQNFDKFTEEEQEMLVEAGDKVDKLVEELKRVDELAEEIDQKVSEGIEDVDQFLNTIENFANKLQEINSGSGDLLDVLKTALKISGQFLVAENG